MRTVSIITTFYNAEMFFGRSIESVLAQRITDEDLHVEYVIINDQSPDNSLMVLNDWVAKFKSIHGGDLPKYLDIKVFTPEKNLGCGGARRYGIEHSTGEYLMFLDADDYYMHNDFVQRAVKTIEETESDIVEYGMLYHGLDGSQQNFTVNSVMTINENPEVALLYLFKYNFIKFQVWSKIIRRSIAEQYRYSDKREFEDVMTIPVWLSLAKKITIMPQIEVNYRAAANSIIRDKMINTRLGTCRAILANFERFKQYPNVLIAMYTRAYIDISALMKGKNSLNEGFNEMSQINTKMLSYIYPETYQKYTV